MGNVKDQMGEIRKMLDKFEPVMDGLSRARNPFELRYFVIGRHDDRIQQYKQAVVELDAKHKACVEAAHGSKLRALEMEKLEMKMIASPKDRAEEIANEETRLAIEKLMREEKEAKIAATGAFKEVLDFISIIENEFSDLVEKSEEELLKSEVDHWKARLSKQIHIDLMTIGRIGEGNLSVLESMPKQLQEEILSISMLRTEEVKALQAGVERKTMVTLAESYPRKTAFIAPPDYTVLKRRKDAPDGYPPSRIVEIDRAEIMIATLHRPGDKLWLSENFYIPSGKNSVKHWQECDRADMIGEWRNRIVKDALSLGCTHLFWVDDDLLVGNDALMKLYAHDLDVVGGWYLKKTPVAESATLISVPGSESKQGVPLDATGMVEVDWSLTAGLTLIKMDVFKKLPYPWYLTTEQGTEDTYFTQRLREAGIKSWLDTSIKAVHVDKATMMGHSFDGVKKVNLV